MNIALKDALQSPLPAAAIRTLPSRRAERLRISWFVLGTLFGTALAYGIFSATHKTPDTSHPSKLAEAIRSYSQEAARFLESSPAPTPAKLSSEPASFPLPEVAAVPQAVPVAKHSKPAISLPADITLTVQHNDTLTSILLDEGISHDEAYRVVESMKKVYNPKRMIIGQSVELHLDKSKSDSNKPTVGGLSIAASPLRTIHVSRKPDDSFTIHETKAPVIKGFARGGGIINSSLYQTGLDSGIPPQLLSEVINALSYDVDFQRDIKEGDKLDVVYERMHTDKNATVGYGSVVYASLTLGDREINLYHHVSADGYSGYYNEKGESVKKALLRTPINGAHITSSFGMRMHPLLGYSKMHKGIDFGAVTGTPIYAAGDGVIAEAGRKGGYGNYVRVKHNNSYETAYGHTSRFARGIHAGVHVKQGQVIAYVGSTGMSTGPHLHYEILVNGAQVNPSGVKFRTGQTLGGHEFAQFRHEVKQVQTALNTLPQKTQVAELAR